MQGTGSDVQHAALYAAELAAFDGTDLEAPIGVTAVSDLVRQVIQSDWWPGPPVTVRATRRDAKSSSLRCTANGPLDSTAVLRLAAPQATVATAAHELAHALAGPGSAHGPPFRRAYLDVIEVITNIDSTDRRHSVHVRQLREAFDAAGLDLADRRWSAPPAHDAGPLAL